MGRAKTGGRKAWVPTPEMLEDIKKYASRFLKEEDIARTVGISPQTFSEKKKTYPELDEAIKAGRAHSALLLGQKLMEVAIQDKHPTMLIFLAKSIMGLRENDPLVQENYTLNIETSKGKETFTF